MTKELLKKLKELQPQENLIEENDQYWAGYKDCLKTVKKIVKSLNMYGVSNSETAVCQHTPKSLGRMIQCEKCGKILSSF